MRTFLFCAIQIQSFSADARTYCTEYDDSVAYIDYDDEEYWRQPIYQTPPYVCGRVLLASVLDSLVTMVRYDVCSTHASHLAPPVKLQQTSAVNRHGLRERSRMHFWLTTPTSDADL